MHRISMGLGPALLLTVGCIAPPPAMGEDESSTSDAPGSTSSEPVTTTGDEPSTTDASTTGGGDGTSTGPEPEPPPPGGLGPWGFGYVEIPEIEAHWVGFADVDADGHVDVLAQRTEGNQRAFTTWRGHGDGSFVEDVSWQLPGDTAFMRSGEFDGEPGLDVAVFHGYEGDSFVLLRNDGRGRLGSPELVPVEGFYGFGVNPMHDDLDGDHDLFVPLGWGEGATVAVAQGEGAFSPGAAVPSPACYFSATAVADLDGDGLDEVLGTGSCNDVPQVLPFTVYRHVDGVLVPDQTIAADLGPILEGCELALVDVDADADLDVVTATDLGLYVLENEGGGVFADPPLVLPHAYADYTQQVIPIAAPPGASLAFVLSNEHDGFALPGPPALVLPDAGWASSTTEMLDLQGWVAGSADVDGDGQTDVAVLVGDGEGPGVLGIWLSGG